MKTQFTKEYISKNKGCYTDSAVEKIPFNKNKEVSLKELFDYLPIRDFNWWLCKKCELTDEQLQVFAVENARYVLPIYEKQYPNDSTVRECVEYTSDFIDGEGDIDTLIKKRAAANAVATSIYNTDGIGAMNYVVAAIAADNAAACAFSHDSGAVYLSYHTSRAVVDIATTPIAYEEMVREFVFQKLLNKK